jgi:hypothetical protein
LSGRCSISTTTTILRSPPVELIKADKSRVKRSDNIVDTDAGPWLSTEKEDDARRATRNERSRWSEREALRWLEVEKRRRREERRVEQREPEVVAEEESGGAEEQRFQSLDARWQETSWGGEGRRGSRKGRWAQKVGAWVSGGERRTAASRGRGAHRRKRHRRSSETRASRETPCAAVATTAATTAAIAAATAARTT